MLYNQTTAVVVCQQARFLNNLVFDFIAALEPLHPSGSVHHLTLTGEEGVTLTADFHLHQLLGGADGKAITTGADYLGILVILGMNLVFHTVHSA